MSRPPLVTRPERTDEEPVEIIMRVKVTNIDENILKADLSKWMAKLFNCKEEKIQITITKYPTLITDVVLATDSDEDVPLAPSHCDRAERARTDEGK